MYGAELQIQQKNDFEEKKYAQNLLLAEATAPYTAAIAKTTVLILSLPLFIFLIPRIVLACIPRCTPIRTKPQYAQNRWILSAKTVFLPEENTLRKTYLEI